MSMKITVYNAVTRDGFLHSKAHEPVLFSHDKIRFNTLVQEADVIVTNWSVFEYFLAHNFLEENKKLIVVLTTQEHKNEWGSRVWITPVDVKGIKRELKIQGFKNVLCVCGSVLVQKFIDAKLIDQLRLSIHSNIEGEGDQVLEKLENFRTVIDVTEELQDKDIVHLIYNIR
jgi:riboflavin biosynthesis pyrimidine reductase